MTEGEDLPEAQKHPVFFSEVIKLCYHDFMKEPRVIGVLAKKGGVGKTLLSVGIAQALSTYGWHVAVLDQDPEGSAMGWDYNAKESGTALPYRVIAPVDAVRHSDVDFLVVDTPPNDVRTLQQVATRADYIVIPVLPGSG